MRFGRAPRPPAWPVVAVVVGMVLIIGGALLGIGTAPTRDVGEVPSAVAATPAPVPRPSRPLPDPVRLRMPALGVDAPVDPVTAPGNDLVIPEDVSRVGWWSDGARPGQALGTVILAGHVDSATQGPGALFRLDAATPGSVVTVSTTSGDVAYTVQAVRNYPKSALPLDLTSADVPGRLAIISCGGPFDRRHRTYLENVVVYATPT